MSTIKVGDKIEISEQYLNDTTNSHIKDNRAMISHGIIREIRLNDYNQVKYFNVDIYINGLSTYPLVHGTMMEAKYLNIYDESPVELAMHTILIGLNKLEKKLIKQFK